MSRDARSVAQTKAAKARFTGPLALPGRATASPANGFLRNTNHETRVTVFMFFTNHESRNASHETRVTALSNRCLLVLKPFSPFFRSGAGLG